MPPPEPGSGSVVLTIGLVVSALCAVGYLLVPRNTATVEETERAARVWADKLGMHTTGVQCEANGACVVMTAEGRPVRAWCGRETCSLRGDP